MAFSPAFQLYPNDWLSSTNITLMTPAEEGAYIRLLCYAWNDPDCSLPNDDAALRALSRLTPDRGDIAKVKKCFIAHPQKSDRLINEKLFKVRKEQEEWREKSRLAGIESGKVRRNKKKKDTKGGSDLVQTKGKPKANSSSSSSSLPSSSFSFSPPASGEEKISSGSGEPNADPTGPNALFELWNKYASQSDLVSARELSKDRQSKCRTRLAERPLEKWDEVFSLCARTPFLNGDNASGWRASFDWILNNPGNAVKVLEGKYENKKRVSGQGTSKTAGNWALLEKMEREGKYE